MTLVAEMPAFACVAGLLEERTSLTRLEARGTIRIALKASGLRADNVSPSQMRIVVERVLPGELEARGIKDMITPAIGTALASLIDETGESPTPEAVFGRLASVD